MPQQRVVDGASLPKRCHRSLQVHGIPQRNRGDDQVEAARAVALILELAIADFSEPIEEHSAGKRVSGLPLVEPGIDAAAQRGVA